MPEFVHTFRGGKMNKDLDERLIPEGEYRDALNLEISASEGSSIGALENIKGTLEIKNKTYNDTTGLFTEWDQEYINYLQNPVSVGSLVDSVNERIYWFVASDNVSAIVEYDKNTSLISPIVVDTNNILKFSSSFLITGINVIEEILLWTDNQTEPKQLNIEQWRNSSTSFLVHSEMYGRPFIEGDITTIRPAPLKAPNVEPSKNLGAVSTETTISYNFTDPIITGSAMGDSIAVGTEVTFNMNSVIDVSEGDIIEFTSSGNNDSGDPSVNDQGDEVDYIFIFNVLAISSDGIQVTAVLQSGTDWITGGIFEYDVKLKGEEVLFELKFPRFGYRFKYKNNQYSPFSPFSEVAFLPSTFEFNSKKGFNSGMVNSAKKITLSGFDSPLPADLTELDILYKESGSAAIYKVETLLPEDLAINYTQYTLDGTSSIVSVDFSYTDTKGVSQTSTLFSGDTIVIIAQENTLNPSSATNVVITTENLGTVFEVTSELIYALVPSNQILRPWDNVPLKAKAQEAISNRIVYANYVQNFNVLDNLEFDTTKTFTSSSPVQFIGEPYKSIKSIRTYQLGVVFRDKYGRETPVFSHTTGVIPIGIENSTNAMRFKVGMLTESPKNIDGSEMFTTFKYFIKDPSAAYYNVSSDRMYESEDGESVWISMPSSETNKVSEEDYLILKKVHDESIAVQNYPSNKFKVLAKKNEAPEELKKTRELQYANDFAFEAVAGSGNPTNIRVPGSTPVEGYDTFNVSDEAGYTGITPDGLDKMSVGSYLRFADPEQNSEWYTIKKRQLHTEGDDEARFFLDRAMGPDVNFLYVDPNDPVSELVSEYSTIEIAKDVAGLGKGQFEGRFFIRLEKTPTLLESFDTQEVGLVPAASAPVVVGYRQQAVYTIFSGGGGQLMDAPSGGNNIGSVNRLGWRTPTNNFPNPTIDAEDGGLWGNGSNDLQDCFNLSNINPDPNVPWDVVFERKIGAPGETAFWGSWAVGKFVQFSTHDTIYKINFIYTAQLNLSSSSFSRKYTRLTKMDGTGGLECSISPHQIIESSGVNPTLGIDGIPVYSPQGRLLYDGTAANYSSFAVVVTVLKRDETPAFSSDNPGIFETEPKEQADLDIYYEASNAIPIAQYNDMTELDWFNCYTYGNGVESNRIRDDFNAAYIDIGTKASTVLAEPYEQERLNNGLIWSGLFNSISSTNSLNQFIAAEAITKNIDPSSGPIQKLFARETDLLTFCEDKVVKILADKDAIYNADGNAQLTANNRVLGQAVIPATFGQFGIGSSPESFATYAYRVYFADNRKGRVMRLSADGVTIISEYGMSDFFTDNLPNSTSAVGFYDSEKGVYNLEIKNFTSEWDTKFVNKIKNSSGIWEDSYATETTVSFDETVGGWTSRKSYVPDGGESVDASLFSFKNGLLYRNYASDTYNNFYGVQYDSSVTLVTNDMPDIIKGFKTLNYSGSESREYIYNFASNINVNYNIAQVEALMSSGSVAPSVSSWTPGWYSSYTKTNLQEGNVKEFLDKEGKYFNYIKGDATYFNTNTDTNLDSHEFSMQGIGRAVVTGDLLSDFNVHVFVNPSCYVSIGAPNSNNMTYTVEEDCSSGTCVILQLSASDPN